MRTHEGGHPVKPGTYVNMATGQILTFSDAEKAVLPPGIGRYARIPILLVFFLAPVVGLAYIIFVPLAGLASLSRLIVNKVRAWIPASAPKSARE